jgi:hypothetical protein
MTSALDKYTAGESKTIEGWLYRIDAEILRTILTAQNVGGLTGSVAEIGVHHGRGFVLLCLGLLKGDRAYCVDIFDDQHLNKDHSGRGNRAILENNLKRFGIAVEQVRIDPRSSALVQPSDVMSQVGPIRLFSIDGGHWQDIVASDLALAEQVLAEYGVIALDDFHRAEWPEVSVGYFKWFAGRKRPIVPFAIGFKQLFLCQSDRVDFYQTVLTGSRSAAQAERAGPWAQGLPQVLRPLRLWPRAGGAGKTIERRRRAPMRRQNCPVRMWPQQICRVCGISPAKAGRRTKFPL